MATAHLLSNYVKERTEINRKESADLSTKLTKLADFKKVLKRENDRIIERVSLLEARLRDQQRTVDSDQADVNRLATLWKRSDEQANLASSIGCWTADHLHTASKHPSRHTGEFHFPPLKPSHLFSECYSGDPQLGGERGGFSDYRFRFNKNDYGATTADGEQGVDQVDNWESQENGAFDIENYVDAM